MLQAGGPQAARAYIWMKITKEPGVKTIPGIAFYTVRQEWLKRQTEQTGLQAPRGHLGGSRGIRRVFFFPLM
jgi:hypothetical protein